MLLKRFYDTKLAQASYLLGCAATGEALVIDANRDIDQYLDAARNENLHITHVTETHIHADFVSGSRELADRAAARLFLSDEGDADWKYAFAADAGATLLHDSDSFMVGNLKIDVMHTPGHTPEHLSFMVTDTPATTRAMGVFTGDFIFVGDVGRPDLLEKAAGVEGSMVAGARSLFGSLQRFRRLPDYLQLWPGHGAGSACGKSRGAMPSTTLGYEQIANWAFGIVEEEAFIAAVLADQPEPPRYFAEMKRINKRGPRILHGVPRPEHLQPSRLRELVDAGATIIDTRSAADYALAHVRGTLNIPTGSIFPTWAGWLLPYDRPLYLIVSEPLARTMDEVVRDLALIGLDRVAGYFGAEVVAASSAMGDRVTTIPQVTARDFATPGAADTDTVLIDVRGRTEWDAGHIPGARHIPLGHLADGVRDLPRTTPLVVQCQGGARSAIAASVLEAHGFTSVTNLVGGLAAWLAAGKPVQHASDSTDASPTTTARRVA